MKKIIQILIIAILAAILAIIIIAAFNPFNLRTKMISATVNSYLNNSIEGYKPIDKNASGPSSNYDHPMLNEQQESMLENYGVDTSQLPSEITPEMEKCFYESLGEKRARELINGASPGPMDIFKARSCL